MVTSYVLVSNPPPLREHTLGERHGVSDICFNQIPSRVVVGSMAVLLKLLKSRDDIDKFLFKRGRVSLVLRRKRSISHRSMIEHAPQSRTLIGEFPMLDEILYEQMKDCIVRRGDSAAHVGLSLIGDTLVREIMRVLQQFIP